MAILHQEIELREFRTAWLEYLALLIAILMFRLSMLKKKIIRRYFEIFIWAQLFKANDVVS